MPASHAALRADRSRASIKRWFTRRTARRGEIASSDVIARRHRRRSNPGQTPHRLPLGCLGPLAMTSYSKEAASRYRRAPGAPWNVTAVARDRRDGHSNGPSDLPPERAVHRQPVAAAEEDGEVEDAEQQRILDAVVVPEIALRDVHAEDDDDHLDEQQQRHRPGEQADCQ